MSSVLLVPLTVVTGLSAPASAASPTVTASPADVTAGDAVTATWSDIVTPTATDWVGLYSSGADGYDYQAYAYTGGGASGSLELTVPASTPAAATYELRLFTNDTFTELAVSGTFAVSGTTPSTAVLTASPTTLVAGSPVTATWSGIASPSAGDWVALYSSASTGTQMFTAWVYTGGGASGTVDVTVPPGTPAGTTYELRLLTNSSYSVLAISEPFTVSRPAALRRTLKNR